MIPNLFEKEQAEMEKTIRAIKWKIDYKATSRKLKMPVSTVWDRIRRIEQKIELQGITVTTEKVSHGFKNDRAKSQTQEETPQ